MAMGNAHVRCCFFPYISFCLNPYTRMVGLRFMNAKSKKHHTTMNAPPAVWISCMLLSMLMVYIFIRSRMRASWLDTDRSVDLVVARYRNRGSLSTELRV